MKATTSLQIDADNILLVQDLSRTKEFSKIVNLLLRQYKVEKKLNYIDVNAENQRLTEMLEKRTIQFEALRKEIARRDKEDETTVEA